MKQALLFFVSFAFCVFTATAVTAGAPAGLKQAANACDNKDDWDVRIAGCTQLLNMKLPAKVRAIAFKQRGEGYLAKHQPDQALPDLDQSARLDSNVAETYTDLASAYMFLGPDDQVIENANKAIRIDPRNEKAYSALAQAYKAKGDYDRAMTAVDTALRFSRNPGWLYAVRADLWLKKKQYDFALTDADTFVRLEAKNGGSYAVRCDVWSERSEFENAIADCSKAIELGIPKLANKSSGYHDRGAVYFRKGDLDQAMSDFNEALRLDPLNAAAFAERADIWRSKGDLERAIKDLDQSIRLSPNLAKAYAVRGMLYEASGDLEKARKDFTAAIERPNVTRSKGYAQQFIDDSTREKETAKARLKALSEAGGPAPESTPPEKAAASGVGRRVALVMGNGSYRNVPALSNPTNDAKAIAKNLRDMGFEVIERTDLDSAGMKSSIATFIRATSTAHLALMFYAGHGMQIDGKNYLVPIDVRLDGTGDITSEMPDLDSILAGLDDRIRTNVIILDACRDNPMAQKAVQVAGASRSVAVRSGLAAPSGLGAGATLGAGTLLAFATAPGQVALDGEGQNSPFSSSLSRHISTQGLEVQQMLTRVRAEVVAATKSKQVPWSNSSLLGEVYLTKGN